jgi:hypothetical protein
VVAVGVVAVSAAGKLRGGNALGAMARTAA